MSRTFKDVPYKLRWELVERVAQCRRVTYSYNAETELIAAVEETDGEFTAWDFVYSGKVPEYYHNSSVPSWWTRIKMNVRQRRAGRLWERRVLLCDIEETDPPGVGRRPKIYYW